jgi:hypothetical protein
MGQTTILDETIDTFDSDTGEITRSTKRRVKKSYTEPTDEFIKVSKYLNTIFAYNNIPLNLVGISLLLAQRMEFKTNIVYLLKSDKKEMAEMLGISEERVKTLLSDCKKYDILRPTDCRGKFAVNAYLFSTGNAVETRNLQAHFDFDNNIYGVCADHKNLITGETVRKSVTNKRNSQIEGQMSFADYLLEKNHE